MKITWTMHPENTVLEHMTVSFAGFNYVIPGYTRHATDDAGKLADERKFRALVQDALDS